LISRSASRAAFAFFFSFESALRWLMSSNLEGGGETCSDSWCQSRDCTGNPDSRSIPVYQNS
jgi:hypothetical protein